MLSKRIISTPEPPLVEIGNYARTRENCINLGQGVPYYQPPDEILEIFAERLVQSDMHQYTPDPGFASFREQLMNKLTSENHLTGNRDNIIITPGANQAFVNVLMTIADPGDNIGLISPYYFNHDMACRLLNLNSIEIPLNSSFQVEEKTISEIKRQAIKAIVIVNPGNPSGSVMGTDSIKLLADALADTDITIICDETYEYFTYGDTQHVSLSSLSSIQHQVITIGSFSKTYGIPGWRLGYYHASSSLINESLKIQDTGPICAPAPAQILGSVLLENRKSIIPKFHGLMKENHKIAKEFIEEISWLSEKTADGAYYVFPEHGFSDFESTKLAFRIIDEVNVVLIPGRAFGDSWKNHFRISFANVTSNNLIEAFDRLKKFQLS